MKNLSSVKCGIKDLEGVLNRVVDGINARTPSAGYGILINETGSGLVIALARKDDEQLQHMMQQLMAGQYIPVDVMDQNCNRSTIWVWGHQ